MSLHNRHFAKAAALAPKGLFRFLSVGMAGLAAHTGVFTLLYHLGLAKSPAWFGGLAVATLITWQLNRRLTFASTGRHGANEMVRYVLVTGVAQAISFGAFLSTGALVPSLPPSIAVIVGAVVATGFSYSGQRFFTFAQPKPPAAVERAAPEATPV